MAAFPEELSLQASLRPEQLLGLMELLCLQIRACWSPVTLEQLYLYLQVQSRSTSFEHLTQVSLAEARMLWIPSVVKGREGKL